MRATWEMNGTRAAGSERSRVGRVSDRSRKARQFHTSPDAQARGQLLAKGTLYVDRTASESGTRHLEFIATYWWLWLIGLIVVLAFVAYRSYTSLFGLARDTVDLAQRIRRAADGDADERRRQLTDLGVELVGEKLKKRALNLVVNIVLLAFGGGCGILLAIAVAQKYAR